LKFGVPIFGSRAFDYWVGNGDNFLIGKFLGATNLGFYSRAYSLVTLPTMRLGVMISSVLFPSMSAIKEDKPRIRLIYLKLLRIVTAIVFPLMGLVLLSAEEIVVLLVGNKWLPSVGLIQILSFVAAIKCIVVLNNSTLLAQGKSDWDFYLNIISGITLIICFSVGVQFGLIYLAWFYLFGVVLIAFSSWMLTGRLIQFRLMDIFESILFQILLSAGLALGLKFTLALFLIEWSHFSRMLVLSLIYCVTWTLLFRIFRKIFRICF